MAKKTGKKPVGKMPMKGKMPMDPSAMPTSGKTKPAGKTGGKPPFGKKKANPFAKKGK